MSIAIKILGVLTAISGLVAGIAVEEFPFLFTLLSGLFWGFLIYAFGVAFHYVESIYYALFGKTLEEDRHQASELRKAPPTESLSKLAGYKMNPPGKE